jgi:hypothetical protein
LGSIVAEGGPHIAVLGDIISGVLERRHDAPAAAGTTERALELLACGLRVLSEQ